MAIVLSEPIAAYFAASNAGDADAVAACFADDALVHDEGRDMRGPGAIRDWTAAAVSRYQPVAEPLQSEDRDGATVVTARVSGTFPGSPADLRYAFVLRGGQIASLRIGG
ncbi:nuclear transport factor 2 family protein [Longimicrobium terrae]|uniref:Ketosteroid isomerase-like protein n=1 Tax=Longimicrobium terrae TaxID=1639882 RepID=A0A841GTC1_9BACT|nr:nuclear transport factor 2 family protein [Longimicrobium terrae]MBB4635395.1 ketosteroid isomerase-like protein [Longimicrobium terrae]MBB6069789.1 ketosteroid isomerase-like protein [Longimicrobium terrae]NNC31002.1 nuclear transport factor 2 family protein [Longimicrobium terrae]